MSIAAPHGQATRAFLRDRPGAEDLPRTEQGGGAIGDVEGEIRAMLKQRYPEPDGGGFPATAYVEAGGLQRTAPFPLQLNDVL